MAIVLGTAGNDVYVGIARVADIGVIDSAQAGTVFSFNGDHWVATGAAGADRLLSIDQAQLTDALFGLTLGGETRVNTTVAGEQSGAEVTALSGGLYAVTWVTGNDGGGYGIHSQIYSAAGERVGVETLVNTTIANNQLTPTIAALTGGGYAVSWLSAVQDGSGLGVYVQRFSAAGAKVGAETLVNTTITGDQSYNAIAGLSGGGFVVTWQSLGTDGVTTDVFAQRFDAAGAKAGGELLVNTTTALTQGDPEITALSGGGFVVAWRSQTAVAGPYDVSLQRFDASGNKLGGETVVTVATDGSSALHSMAITALAGGGFVASWYSPTDALLHFQLFNASGVKINGETVAGAGSRPAVASLSSGGFVVAWEGVDGSGVGVFVQRYDASGFKVGAAIAVNSFTGGEQSDVAVATLPGGEFVVTWQSLSQDGSSYGIYSQRFAADGTAILPELSGDDLPNILNYTGAAPVRLEGNAGNDTLNGGSGNDVLDGGTGNDTMRGGVGNDTYIADAGDRIIEAASAGIDTVLVAASYTMTSANLENATLTGTAAGSLIGNTLANVLTGNAADNTLNGGEGADRMIGGLGNDTYLVDDAYDNLAPSDPFDVVVENAGEGIDTVVSSDSYVLGANLENLRLIGTSAQDAVGNALDNQITGNAGDNVLQGLGGADILIGDDGDDDYYVDASDQVFENANEGDDAVVSAGSWMLGDNFESLYLAGTGNFNGTGNELANSLFGNGGNNVLDGGLGSDSMLGGDGNDTYMVDDAGDFTSDNGTGLDQTRSTVTHTLGFGIENLALLGDANIDGYGNALANVLRGTSGNNRLEGGAGSDVLYGNFGNDELVSADGLDTLIGGSGDDRYVVNGNSDEVIELSAQGTDTVTAAVARSYTLGLNLENLILLGANVTGAGNALNNQITGTSGNNLLDGGAGADQLAGQSGNDTYIVDNAADTIVEALAEGTDTVLSSVTFTLANNVDNLTLTGAAALNGTGNGIANRITGNDAANILSGGIGNDVLVGGGSNDQLLGGNDSDTLNGGLGNDILNGGLGFDIAYYIQIGAGVTVNLNLTSAQNTGAAGTDTLIDVEHVYGSNAGGDTLTGNASTNKLYGYAGNDTLAGGAGNDVLYGGEDNDLIFGDADNDVLDGGNGIDTVSFAQVAAAVTINLNLAGAQATGAGTDIIRNFENIEGSATGADRLTGDFGNNIIFGLGGNDVLAGDEGNDYLDGGTGTDTADYSGAFGAVIVDLSLGQATDDGSGTTDTLVSIESLTGSDFDDVLLGNSGENTLNGGAGADVLRGGAGNDTYVVDNVGDRLTEAVGAGTDTVLSSISFNLTTLQIETLTLTGTAAINSSGNAFDNVITGNGANNILSGVDGNDRLVGGAGLDTLSGGNGLDKLLGGLGNDALSGGTGADMFYFDSALGATNVDTISDFAVVDDTIMLLGSVFGAIATGALGASAFQLGTAANDALDRIIYNSATGDIFYDADGNGIGAQVRFAKVTAGTALTSADFTVVTTTAAEAWGGKAAAQAAVDADYFVI